MFLDTCYRNVLNNTAAKLVQQPWYPMGYMMKGNYSYFKASESDKGTFGALHAPTILYLEYVTQLEDLFTSSFSVYPKRSCVGKTILAKLKRAPVPFKTCPDFPLDYLLKLFLQMTIYYGLKFANRDFTSTKKKGQEIYTLRSRICNQVNSRTF